MRYSDIWKKTERISAASVHPVRSGGCVPVFLSWQIERGLDIAITFLHLMKLFKFSAHLQKKVLAAKLLVPHLPLQVPSSLSCDYRSHPWHLYRVPGCLSAEESRPCLLQFLLPLSIFPARGHLSWLNISSSKLTWPRIKGSIFVIVLFTLNSWCAV